MTDAEAETPVLWLPDAKNWLIGKDHPDAEKDWRWKEKRTTEDEMVGWHHWLDDISLSKLQGQGSLACCSPWGCKESDMTEQLNWIDQTIFQNGYTILYSHEWYTRIPVTLQEFSFHSYSIVLFHSSHWILLFPWWIFFDPLIYLFPVFHVQHIWI